MTATKPSAIMTAWDFSIPGLSFVSAPPTMKITRPATIRMIPRIILVAVYLRNDEDRTRWRCDLVASPLVRSGDLVLVGLGLGDDEGLYDDLDAGDLQADEPADRSTDDVHHHGPSLEERLRGEEQIKADADSQDDDQEEDDAPEDEGPVVVWVLSGRLQGLVDAVTDGIDRAGEESECEEDGRDEVVRIVQG